MPHQSLFVFDIETVPDTDTVPDLTGFVRIRTPRPDGPRSNGIIWISPMAAMPFRASPFIKVMTISLLETQQGERPHLGEFMEARGVACDNTFML